MKTIILCGGKGSRLSEETRTIPKPMVKIGNKPILSHIINIYENYGFHDFILATGYKSSLIKEFYFKKKNKSKIKYFIIKYKKTSIYPALIYLWFFFKFFNFTFI